MFGSAEHPPSCNARYHTQLHIDKYVASRENDVRRLLAWRAVLNGSALGIQLISTTSTILMLFSRVGGDPNYIIHSLQDPS
jgi:hypothetical protein